MKIKSKLLYLTAMAALMSGENSYSKPQTEITGKALVYPPEQPKLSKKAKAKLKSKNKK